MEVPTVGDLDSVCIRGWRESGNQSKYLCWVLFSAVAVIIVYFTSPSPRICPSVGMVP